MHKAKIMIVEDEGLVGLDIQSNLQDLGYKVTPVFADANAAILYLSEEHVDLVLMDIHLKGQLDGIDAARTIRERFDIPVLFLTAFANNEVIQRAKGVGAFGYLLKPFKAKELEVMVEIIFSKHKVDKKNAIVNNQLHRAQKYESLRLMAGGVAHQFNNNLHAVLGNLSLVLEELPAESHARIGLIEAEKAAWKAAELSKQMLAFSGHGHVNTTELDVSKFISQLKHLLKSLTSDSVFIGYDLTDDLPFIVADPGQLKQVIFSLVINATEAINKTSGIISVKTGLIYCDAEFLSPIRYNQFLDEGYYVYIDVIDTGHGMSSSTMQQVFDPFFSTKFIGRGLGLPSSLGLIQAHRGTIKILSTMGKGTSVKVLIPVGKNQSDHIEKLVNSTNSHTTVTGTILLVEDEDIVSQVTRTMLEKQGYKVLDAVNGFDAVNIYREKSEEIVLVLLDNTMAGMSGEETFKSLKEINPDVLVILSSGYGREEATQKFADGDLAGFIQKPYNLKTLITSLQKVLS